MVKEDRKVEDKKIINKLIECKKNYVIKAKRYEI